MADLPNLTNIHANLAQSSYRNREKNLPFETLDKEKKARLAAGKSVKIDYGNAVGGVYLQPDLSVKTIKVTRTIRVPKGNGNYEEKNYVHSTYRKGLLTDEKVGYHAYFATDTPKLSEQTKNTYFITRGSEDIKAGPMHDWWENNAQFTLKDAYVPQAHLATEAMHKKISEMVQKAPQAKMNITGHSLGTMVSIQAVANLPAEDIDKIGQVVLFQGPDARESIANMSPQAQENIKKLEVAGKIDYYVNPFDLVSMLNRNKKGVDEIGKVHYLLPKSYTTTSDMWVKNGSSHDFGQYQLAADGTVRVANINEHPEIFVAGRELSTFIERTLAQLDRLLVPGSLAAIALLATLSSGSANTVTDMIAVTGGALPYKQAEQMYTEYLTIIEKAQQASQRAATVHSLQNQIHQSDGVQQIQLQEQLVNTVAAQAVEFGTEYQTIVDTIVTETEAEIDEIVQEVEAAAWSLQRYLSAAEVEELLADFKKETLWDAEVATDIMKQTKAYAHKLTEARTLLGKATTTIVYADAQAAELFQMKMV